MKRSKLKLEKEVQLTGDFASDIEILSKQDTGTTIRKYLLYEYAYPQPSWVKIFWNRWENAGNEFELKLLTKIANEYVYEDKEPKNL